MPIIPDADRGTRGAIALLFFVSGACGLVHQIIWVRLLLPIFGTSVHAVSAVLTAFMAGLALGAWLLGREADRRRRPLRFFAVLEFGIAACALLLPWALAGLDEVYTWLYRRLGDSPSTFAAARFVLAGSLLLVPAALMGGTLPALVREFTLRHGSIGRSAGLLYGLNTLGAALGSLFAAMVAFEHFGVSGTVYIAAAGNLIVALAALGLGRRRSAETPRQPESPSDASRPTSAPLHRAIYWGYGLSGFAALAYEVLWSRLLSIVLGITTTQSLSTVLVVYLLGLAAGGAVGGRWVDRLQRPASAFGLLEIALGSAAVLSVAAFGLVLPIASALGGLPGWSGHATRLLAAAAVVMALPTFLMGLLFPVAGRLHAAAGVGVGRRIGSIYAVNTAGAVLGAFASSHLLLPTLGSQRTMWLLAALNIGVGAVVLALTRDVSPGRVALRAGVLAAPAVIVCATLPSTFLIEQFRTDPRARLIHADEGAAGTVTVHEYPDDMRVLRVNGAGEVPTDRPSIRVFRLLGTLPLVVHPDPQEVLVIAFGGGITLAAVEAQAPRRIDCVELVPQVLGAAPYFDGYNNGVFRRVGAGRIRLLFDDGRNHVLRTERRYDVIISDSTHPATADSWVLYTEEFYRLSRERLLPGGVFAQWLPIHGLTLDDYRMILRTFRVAFPDATLWTTRGYSVLLGTTAPLSIDYGRLVARLAGDGVQVPLAAVNLDRPAAFLATLALDAPTFARFAGSGPTNTDDRPYLGFGDRQRAGAGSGQHIVVALRPFLVPSTALRIDGADAAALDAIAREFAARREAPR